MSTAERNGHNHQAEDNDNDKNTAQATALMAASDQDLRVPCYCEENVWRLAYRKLNSRCSTTTTTTTTEENSNSTAAATTSKQYHVIFVSNPSKCVCFFHQRANVNPLSPVFWDYHVLLLEYDPSSSTTNQQPTAMILDIDSYLPYPYSLSDYLDQAFPSITDKTTAAKSTRVAPCFRVIPAEIYLQHFCSDRSHMWDPVKQEWLASPPTYQCIQGQGNGGDDTTKSNLMTYIDMKSNLNDPIYGCVFATRQQLKERFL